MDQAIETSLGSPWTPTGPGPSMQGPGLWVLEDVCWWWASWLLGDHGLCLGFLHFGHGFGHQLGSLLQQLGASWVWWHSLCLGLWVCGRRRWLLGRRFGLLGTHERLSLDWHGLGLHGHAFGLHGSGLHGSGLGLHGDALGLHGDALCSGMGNHGWRVPQVREWERHSHRHGHWHGVLVWSGEAGLWEQVGLVHRASWLGRPCTTRKVQCWGGVVWKGQVGWKLLVTLAGVLALAGGLGDSVSTGVRGLGTACAIQAKKKKKKKSRNMASSSTLGPGLDLALLLAACGKISLQPQFHSSLTTKIMCTLEIMKVPSLNLTP